MTSNRLWRGQIVYVCVCLNVSDCTMCIMCVCLRLRVNHESGVRVFVHLLHPDTWG